MQLPDQVPVMTLSSATLFPQALLPLYIFEPRYRRMLSDALRADRVFSVAMQKPGRSRETPCEVAGLGLIRASLDHRDGTAHLILQGLTRVRLMKPVQYKPYRIHSIQVLRTPLTSSVTLDALTAKVLELVRQRLELGPFPCPCSLGKNPGSSQVTSGERAASPASVKEILKYLERLPDAEQLADLVAYALLPDPLQRQTLLEAVDLELRLRHLIHFLMAEIRRQQKNHPA
jgi:Lon protease-like protein